MFIVIIVIGDNFIFIQKSVRMRNNEGWVQNLEKGSKCYFKIYYINIFENVIYFKNNWNVLGF